MLTVAKEQVDLITAAIARLLAGEAPGDIEIPADHAADEIGQLVTFFNRIVAEYLASQAFLLALSRGDLDSPPPKSRLAMLDSAKNLQASLRHLTWKTQQVAKGDFSQRLDFMGEFSESFNWMVEQLAAHRDEMLRKNEELIAEDVARKKALDALRESENRYRILFESSRDAIMTLFPPDWKFTSGNPATVAMFGAKDETDFTSRGPWDVSPDFQPDGELSAVKANSMIEEAMEKGSLFFEWTHKKIAGPDFTATVLLTRVELGGKTGLQATVRDISQQKRAEAVVAARTIELQAATKELEAFSYSVSHDLRAPLRAIDGFGHALLEDCEAKLDADGKDHLRRIRAATQRMGTLIDDLLRLSRLTRTEMLVEKVNLTELAWSVINELQKSEPERVVRIEIAEGLEVTADPKLIRIALENLLGNAWKFTGKRPDAVIELGSTTEGAKTTCFVRDNGAGFDMAYVNKLFTPFQRLHSMEEYPGTGIGLGTVQRIVNRHGGKVWAEGQVDKGATFYFSFQR